MQVSGVTGHHFTQYYSLAKYKSLWLALSPWLGPGTQLRGKLGCVKNSALSFPAGWSFPKDHELLVPQFLHRRVDINFFL